jgi:hypothetical protein
MRIIIREARIALFKTNTPLNKQLINGRVEKSITLNTIKISHEDARLAMWFQYLAFLCRNVSPCSGTKHFKVLDYWFLTAQCLEKSDSLQRFVRNFVLDIADAINGFYPELYAEF